jgi:hypothetical protein
VARNASHNYGFAPPDSLMQLARETTNDISSN